MSELETLRQQLVELIQEIQQVKEQIVSLESRVQQGLEKIGKPPEEPGEISFVRCLSCRSLSPATNTKCRMCGASLNQMPS
jgi:predicted  nucleic acid-binding Zn-ribbon protein